MERCGHIKMDLEKINCCVPKKKSHDFARNNKQYSISTSTATTTTNGTHHSQHSQQHRWASTTMTGARDTYVSQALDMFSLIFTFFYNSTNTFTERWNMTTGTTNGHHYCCHSKVTAGHNDLPHPPQSAQGKDMLYNGENKKWPKRHR